MGDAASYRPNDARVSALDYAAYEPPWKIRVASDVAVGPSVDGPGVDRPHQEYSTCFIFLPSGWNHAWDGSP